MTVNNSLLKKSIQGVWPIQEKVYKRLIKGLTLTLMKQLAKLWLTFVLPISTVFPESETVNAVVIDAVKMPDNAMPNTIQKIAKIRDRIDVGQTN